MESARVYVSESIDSNLSVYLFSFVGLLLAHERSVLCCCCNLARYSRPVVGIYLFVIVLVETCDMSSRAANQEQHEHEHEHEHERVAILGSTTTAAATLGSPSFERRDPKFAS